MAANSPAGVSLTELAGGIIEDSRRLIRQELELARLEMLAEWEKAKTAGLHLGSGAVLTLIASTSSALALVCVLHEAVGLPWWGSFAIIAGLAAAAATALLMIGRRKAAEVNLVPQQALNELGRTVETTQGKVAEAVQVAEAKVSDAVRHTTATFHEVTHGSTAR